MNKNKFKSIMSLHGDTQRTTAEAIGISEQTMSEKINGVSEFKTSEIRTLIKRWDLTAYEVCDTFFGGDGDEG